ncbi:hypothetical protein JXA47_01895 [Candidatus Sumerlaeota bacterium]|nr:hypothetical protein [Candidatus Sumerlaeota bacterium]
MANLKRVLLLTENEKLRSYMMPLSQWLELHAPLKPIEGLEHIHTHSPDIFVLDSKALTPMVNALLTTIRQMPRYETVPLIMLGEAPQARRFHCNHRVTGTLNLRRLEQKIAELLEIRLVGRGSHGPHHGSIY